MTDLLLGLCFLYFAMSHQSKLNSLDNNQQTRLQCKNIMDFLWLFVVLFFFLLCDRWGDSQVYYLPVLFYFRRCICRVGNRRRQQQQQRQPDKRCSWQYECPTVRWLRWQWIKMTYITLYNIVIWGTGRYSSISGSFIILT